MMKMCMRNPLFLITLPLLLFVSACSQTQVIPLYEGAAREDDQLLVLKVPPRLEILSINGQEVELDAPLFGSGDRVLHLEPGGYRILAFYRELWEERTGGHRTLLSDGITFALEGDAGERYRLEYDRPGNIREAEALAADFHGWIENLDTGERIAAEPETVPLQRGVLASSRPDVRETRIRPAQTVAAAPVDTSTTARTQAEDKDAPEEEKQYLDLLKAYWSQATEEERREFLRWISE